jgi:hypothetical protein
MAGSDCATSMATSRHTVARMRVPTCFPFTLPQGWQPSRQSLMRDCSQVTCRTWCIRTSYIDLC